MSLEVGQTIAGYEIVGVLGAGGMGSVYKVRNTISGRLDAMKVLLPELVASVDLGDRFLNEIRVLAGLSHPNIAALHTALQCDGQILMIMEFVEGGNLDDRLRSGPIPVPESIRCISQVLSALEYAHQRGVVHRDIKPANIAVQPDGHVKLLDFGIARVGSIRLTRTGLVLGSLYYMSPEQVNGDPADARSDLYAAAGTLYRMITGVRPVEGENEFALMRAQVGDMPVPPIERNPSIPREVSAAIMRALMKSPADRFQSAAEFKAALGAHPDATGNTPIPSSTLFSSAVLAIVQKHLARAIGPIASALVRKHSRTAPALPDLCSTLAAQIQDGSQRAAFLKACDAELGIRAGTPTTAAMVSRGPEPAWDPLILERSRKDLAAYIGPLAKIIVERAAKRARTLDDLYTLIAAEIPSQKDRDRFLTSR